MMYGPREPDDAGRRSGKVGGQEYALNRLVDRVDALIRFGDSSWTTGVIQGILERGDVRDIYE